MHPINLPKWVLTNGRLLYAKFTEIATLKLAAECLGPISRKDIKPFKRTVYDGLAYRMAIVKIITTGIFQRPFVRMEGDRGSF